MSILYSIIVSILFFIVLPQILGRIWKSIINGGGIVHTYISGFITIFAIFEVLGVPMVFAFVPLHIQRIVFSVVFIVMAAVIVINEIRTASVISLHDKTRNVVLYFRSFSKYEWIYFIIMVGLLLVQVYYTVFYHFGRFRSDDGTYTVISSSAIYNDGFFLTSLVEGKYSRIIPAKYGFCGLYIFYAYASLITRLGVPVITQTLFSAILILMAYGACYLLSRLAFWGVKKRDDRMIFISLVSIAFLFGLYSQYSLTYRLLGAIWQGKAILAVFITPYLLALLPQLFKIRRTGISILYVSMVSLAAISLTIGGTIVMIVITGVLVALNLIESKNVKALLYLPAACAFPLVDVVLYMFYT